MTRTQYETLAAFIWDLSSSDKEIEDGKSKTLLPLFETYFMNFQHECRATREWRINEK